MKPLRLALFALGAVFAALMVGRWQGARAANVSAADRIAAVNGARLADLRRWQRDSLTIATKAREASDRQHRHEVARLTARVRESEGVVSLAQDALADTARTMATMEAALTMTTEALALAAIDLTTHLAADAERDSTTAHERRLLMASVVTADSSMLHWRTQAQRIARKDNWTARLVRTGCGGLFAVTGAAGGAAAGEMKGAAIGAALGVAIGAVTCR